MTFSRRSARTELRANIALRSTTHDRPSSFLYVHDSKKLGRVVKRLSYRTKIGLRTDFKSGFFLALTQSRTRLTKTQLMKVGRWHVDTLPQNLNFTIDSFIDHGRNTVDSASSTRYYAELHPKHDTIHAVVIQIDNQKRQKS